MVSIYFAFISEYFNSDDSQCLYITILEEIYSENSNASVVIFLKINYIFSFLRIIKKLFFEVNIQFSKLCINKILSLQFVTNLIHLVCYKKCPEPRGSYIIQK